MTPNNIDKKKLNKLYRKSPNEAIHYVQDVTGWDLKTCSKYAYDLCDKNAHKKEHPVLGVLLEILDFIIDLFSPYY